MIEALIICISVLIVSATIFIKKQKKESQDYCSEELSKYYSLLDEGVPTHTLQKQLINCAQKINEEMHEIDEEKTKLYYLYMDRLISEEWWNRLKEKVKLLNDEKMLVIGEAESIQQGLGEKIFEMTNKHQEKKHKKKPHGSEDLFHKKKKEILERELFKKMCAKEEMAVVK